jgi:curved DNA-binding protein CbpA
MALPSDPCVMRGRRSPCHVQGPALINFIRMNGQLSEQPLGELIREISSKKLSGRLRLQNDRVAVVTYFEDGAFLYAAANVRTLRLGEYLLKRNLISEDQLLRIGDKKSDLQVASEVVNENLVDANTVKSLQLKQQVDTIRMALLWTEGTWEFDYRSHLNEKVDLRLNVQDLFLEAGRRLPHQFVASRFRNEQEVISLNENATNANRLEPREGFILSRLDSPTPLKELLVLSGLRDEDALRIIYSLALAGYVRRENWKSAFRDEVPSRPSEVEKIVDDAVQAVAGGQELSLADFLGRVEAATTHYEVLAVSDDAPATDIKTAYYDIARRYHPDRFRRDNNESLHTRLEALFARITQAYETLGDTGHRAAYDSKLAARKNASQPLASKIETPTPTAATRDDKVSMPTQDVELKFKEGLAVLQRGQVNEAIAIFASLTNLAPNDARYHAFHGRALAGNAHTRRRAEVELREALKLEPENPDFRTMLAELYRDLGFARRARAEAERALATAPNHQGARKLLGSLE